MLQKHKKDHISREGSEMSSWGNFVMDTVAPVDID